MGLAEKEKKMKNFKPIPIDTVMDFEDGKLSDQEIFKLFQHLVDTGLVWELNGYPNLAYELAQHGYIDFCN